MVTYFNFYNAFPHLDKVLHVSGGFIVAWFFTRLWLGLERIEIFNKFEYLVLCIALAAMVGFFWELMEYTASVPPLEQYYWIHHYIYIGNVTDTLGDLLADIFGGALFGLIDHHTRSSFL